ncbi:MAG TPA: hypothetical protein VMZ00_17730 [Sporichthya sp.]|nr:hypothetical protein [Sporichthya sp.]
MEITKNSVVMTPLGVTGVPAQGCYGRQWDAHVLGGVSIAPTTTPSLKQDSVVMTAAVATAPRTNANPFSTVARSGIRTPGPPV